MTKTFSTFIASGTLVAAVTLIPTLAHQTTTPPTLSPHHNATTQHSTSSSNTSSYIFPTSNNTIVRPYNPPTVRWQAGHRGVDIKVAPGDTIVAAADGTVLYVGTINNRPVISIEHSGGIRTTYEPVSATVAQGEHVNQGDIIGTIELGHCPTITCLHWGAKRGKDDYINPLSLVDNGYVRLYE